MSIMSPSQSPQGLFPSNNLGITRINKKVVGILLLIFGGAAIILLVTITSRGAKKEQAVTSEPQKAAKASMAALPEFKVNAQPGTSATATSNPGFIGSTVNSFNGTPITPETDPDLIKEKAEFAKEIRMYEHQQHMQRLFRRDQARSSTMEARGVSPSSPSAESNGMALQDGAAVLESTADGQMALGSPGALSMGAGLVENDPNLQGRKETFYGQEKTSAYLPYRKESPLSPYEVKQGTVIPGIMVTGINSDLPGQIIAQVSQNVYDSTTGKSLLIPQGTKIVGSYDSVVAIGQERAMVAWRRLIYPDGMSLELLNMPGADQGGYSGFSDQVNNHYFKIFGSAIMLSLVGAGYQISQPHSNGEFPSNQEIIAAEVGRQFAQVSGELIRRNMQIQPTIEIRPGYRFVIMVNKDMILEPYVEK
ncbi:MAG: hypothetical protein EOP04_01585 [Proteobacteria bacterium]|nr:MAG: hypothetical protein EOP04_01585 [Pseudomonadota bacterium]